MTAVVGRSVRRSDGDAKVRGAAVYTIDYEEPHLLHARVLRSWLPAARIVRLDASQAERMPGVRAVATAADAARLSGHVVRDQPLFAGDVVRYEGEPIAAVAAEGWEEARAALRAIEVELEPLEPVLDLELAVAPTTRLIHPDWESYEVKLPGPREGNVAWESSLNRGDTDAAFARADLVVEDEFVSHRQHQSYIEPRGCVARYENGRYVIHSSTQWPFNARDGTAEYLGVRPTDVRVIVPAVGGAFGGKLICSLEPLAAVLARKAGRPVKLVNTRREEFLAGNPRENALIRLRSALAREGEILAQESTVLLDNGAYSGEMPFIAGAVAMVLCSNYRIGAIRHVTRLVYTNTPPTGAFRGVMGPYCMFALERHIDHIALELGLDRRELRLRNVYRDGNHGPTGQHLPQVAFQEALDRVEQRAPWAEVSRKRPYHGVGIGCLMWLTNPMPGSVTLKLNEDGTVGVVTAATECGTGAMASGVTQIVAEELGVRPEDVVLVQPDTDTAPYDAGAQGSRTTFSVGNAVRDAAEIVRAQILETASRTMEVAPTDLELVEGEVRVVGSPDRSVSLASVATSALWTSGPIAGAGKHVAPPIPFDASCSVGSYLTTFTAATFHVHLAEVEVDPETGKVTILRYVVAQDVGKAINPAGIEGQIHGGVVQGIGYALFENVRLEEGRCLERGFSTYRVPMASDAPPIEIILLEYPDAGGPFGAKGVAEPPIVPVAAVLANAVSDAIGRPLNRLPITPFDVLAALREEGKERGSR